MGRSLFIIECIEACKGGAYLLLIVLKCVKRRSIFFIVCIEACKGEEPIFN